MILYIKYLKERKKVMIEFIIFIVILYIIIKYSKKENNMYNGGGIMNKIMSIDIV